MTLTDCNRLGEVNFLITETSEHYLFVGALTRPMLVRVES